MRGANHKTGLRCIWLSAVLLSQAAVPGQQPAPEPSPLSVIAPAEKWNQSCTLEGRTIDADTGRPVHEAELILRRISASQSNSSIRVLSDSKGRFTFEYLEPGTYLLTMRGLGYASLAYGARSAFTYGTPLVLPAGSRRKDMEVKLVRPGSISGKVVGEKGRGMKRADVTAVAAFGTGPGGGAQAPQGGTDPAGRFEIRDLAPGRYVLRADEVSLTGTDAPAPHLRTGYFPAAPWTQEGRWLVVRPGEKLTDVTITLPEGPVYAVSGRVIGNSASTEDHAPVSLAGLLRVDGQSEPDFSGVTLRLDPSPNSSLQPKESRAERSGLFWVWGLPADVYTVRFFDLPDGTYVKSIHLGEQELVNSRLDLTRGQAVVSLIVSLDANAAAVEGTVLKSGKPVMGAWVTLTPADGSGVRGPLVSDVSGRIRLDNVAPGTYHVYAWEELPYRALTDPSFLKPFESKATAVTLKEGDRAKLEVAVIEFEDLAIK